jgi:hypothetical protein
MAFDSQGRLVYVTVVGDVRVSDGGTPSVLYDLPSAGRFLAIDSADRIYTSTEDGTIRIHASDGSLLNAMFASDLGCCTSMAFGSGGIWGDDLYAISGGRLLR